MPKYILEDVMPEPTLKALLETAAGGELDVYFVAPDGSSNHILTFEADGSLQLHELSEGWAKVVGIKTDADRKILVR